MRNLVVKISVSLDGFVSGPNGEIDWIFKTVQGATDWLVETLGQAGAHAMGSKTYYGMAAFWPYSDSPIAAPMNDIPKVVFSRKGLVDVASAHASTALSDARRAEARSSAKLEPTELVKKSWAQPTVARGDLANEIARLKAQPGKDILVHGGASFVQDLAAKGLVDEYKLLVHPVVLGKGHALFSRVAQPADLRLKSATTLVGGAIALVYKPLL